MSISSSAVLVELNISVWTANKLDKGATDAVLASNMASKDSAQVRKNLMAGTDKRKKISDLAARVRLYHNQTTFAWADKGARGLPTSLFMEYKQTMNVYQANMNAMVDNFIDSFDDLVGVSQHFMGTLFNASDYPTKEQLREKFGFRLVFSPLPESGDFRVDIPSAEIKELSNQYEGAYNDRLTSAMNEQWDKLYTELTTISKKLTVVEGADEDDKATKKRYHDTLITNAQDLCNMLTHLNITKDPKLEQARHELELTMLGADIEKVKDSAHERANLKAKVDTILGKFDW